MNDSGTTQIRLVLIDDHELIRAGLRMLIETNPQYKVVGEAGTGAAAVQVAAREQPEIILLDLNLGDDSGFDYLPRLQAAAPNARVLILTGSRELEAHQLAIRLGAKGLVLKDKAGDVLLKAIEKVHAGEVWFDRGLMGSLIEGLSHKPTPPVDKAATDIATLTDREREVIALVGEGLRNKPLADRLFISDTTVRHHLTSVYSKLGVQDRLELIIYAYRHGLAKPPP